MPDSISHPHDPIKIDYIEFHVLDISKSKKFYADVFNWSFQDFGDSYTSFNCGNLTGGFSKADAVRAGGPIVVMYAKDLPEMQRRITKAGGKIVRETFSFPGG